MKKVAVVLLLLLTSCTGIEVIRDEYRNVTIVESTLYNLSDDPYGQKRSMETVFKRVVDASSKKETLSIRIKLHLAPTDEKLNEGLYIKADDRLFTLAMTELSQTSETFVGTNMNHATGQNQVYSYNAQGGRGTVSLNPEIHEALKQCTMFQIRVYSGDRPFSFTYSGYDLARLKYFLNYEVD